MPPAKSKPQKKDQSSKATNKATPANLLNLPDCAPKSNSKTNLTNNKETERHDGLDEKFARFQALYMQEITREEATRATLDGSIVSRFDNRLIEETLTRK